MKIKKTGNNVGYFALLLLSLFFIPLKDVMGQSMTDHLWEKRVLLIFSPDEHEEVFRMQRKVFSTSEKKMQDRDLILYQIFSQSGRTPVGEPLSREKIEDWRKRWGVDPTDFLLVLIGKDGGTKYKSSKRIDPSVIFDLIDSMPMRKAEMRDSVVGKPKADSRRSNED